MSVTLIIGTAVVVASCIAFVAVGAAYSWDVTAIGHGRWTRAVGACALLALTVLGVWDRRHAQLPAVAIAMAGAGLTFGFVIAHAKLSKKVRDTSS